MEKVFVVAVLVLFANSCSSKSLPEEDSVVSVYTTQATTSGTSGLDIYQQIANNLAEKISSPFYRLFRVERNKTEDQPITKKPWSKIELLDDPEPTQFKEDNEIGRDVEELSIDALKKRTKKPEKITLYNSYLPVLGLSQKIEQVDQNDTVNDSVNNIDDDIEDELTLDDVEPTPREGPFIFILELIGSLIQLAWGAISSIFPSFSGFSSTSQTEQTN